MFRRAAYAPSGLMTLNAVIAPTWPTSTVPAASARTPSKSGNRGLPGGGATASGAAERLTVRAAYAAAGHRLARVTRRIGFRGTLALVALAAVAIRTGATLRHRDYPVIGDALTFHIEGSFLAHGEGFRRVFEDVPTAEHPPLLVCLLALFTLLGGDGILAQKRRFGLVGSVAFVLVGLLGRSVAGDRAGIVAAALAAVHPLLWLADGALMSEALYGPVVWGGCSRPARTPERGPPRARRSSGRSSAWRRSRAARRCCSCRSSRSRCSRARRCSVACGWRTWARSSARSCSCSRRGRSATR